MERKIKKILLYFVIKILINVYKVIIICTILLASREVKLRPIMSYHYMPIRRDEIKNSDKTKANKEN